MKLLTHNMLASNVPKATVTYPLGLVVTKYEIEDNEYAEEFIVNMIPRLDYGVLVLAARTLGTELPASPPEDYLHNSEFLHLLHHCLLNLEILEGSLICPSTQRVFPIVDGIPNMLLNENETV